MKKIREPLAGIIVDDVRYELLQAEVEVSVDGGPSRTHRISNALQE